MAGRHNFPDRVKARQDAAKERQTFREGLSPKQQLERIKTRPGKSAKETARLVKASRK